MTIREIINKIHSKDAKMLLANFISLSALQVANFVFPLITLPYLSKVLGVEKFGIIALASAIMAYFQTFTEYGFNFTAVRDLAKNRDNADVISKIYSLTLSSRIFLLLCSFLILFICVCCIPYLYDIRLILFYTFLIIPGWVLISDWFFQGIEDMKYITILNFISKLIFTILVFVCIKTESDYIYQPLLIAIGNIFVGIISCWMVRCKYNIKFQMTPIADVLVYLKSGFSMFISNFIPTIYNQLNSILLSTTTGGNRAIGLYSSGNKFISISYQVINTMSRTVFPFLARKSYNHKYYAAITFIFAFICSLVFFFSADMIIDFFYTPEFSDAIKVLKIMAFTPIAIFLMNTYGINYLVLKNQEGVLRKIVLITSLCGIILTICLIWKFSYIGVAISSTVTQFLRGVIVYLYSRKFK